MAPSGQVFVSEHSNTVRAITSLGEVTTLAGTAGNTGSANGQGPAASFDGPTGMALDADGNLYVTDFFNDTVRKVTSQGMVSTLAGSPLAEGSADGAGSAAGFNGPCGVVVMPGGNLLVSDSFSGTIRMITPEGEVTTILGVAGVNEQVPGIFPSAWFSPAGLALDPVRGELYLSTNNAILKVRLQPQAY